MCYSIFSNKIWHLVDSLGQKSLYLMDFIFHTQNLLKEEIIFAKSIKSGESDIWKNQDISRLWGPP